MCFPEVTIKKKKILIASDRSHVYQKVNVSVAILGCIKFGQIRPQTHNGLFESWLLKRKK